VGAILIVGRLDDPCCRLVQQRLVERGRDVALVPEDRLLPGLGFAWKPGPGAQGSVGYDGRKIRFAEVDAILSRAWSVPVSPQAFETGDGRYVCAEWNALLMAWLHAMPCIVVNRLRPELWYKAQLNPADLASLLPEMPFRLPRSLVTTNLDDANAFYRSVRGATRYSPLTGASRYRIETETDREKLAALNGSLPLHLTEVIEGRVVEAFVVPPGVLFVDEAGRLIAEGGDAVARPCVEIADALGLGFCRLALVDARDGDWYCLGVDRAPHLYNCAPETQDRIARALARVLSPAAGPQ
jgi:hypothetical protein